MVVEDNDNLELEYDEDWLTDVYGTDDIFEIADIMDNLDELEDYSDYV